jgi:glycosyltransferase involved in cell wall biosynthesis
VKIVLIVDNLKQGGAQKSALMLAESFHNNGYETELLVLDSAKSDFFKIYAPIKVERIELLFHNARVSKFNNSLRTLFLIPYFATRDLAVVRRYLKNSNADLFLAIESHVGVLIGLVVPFKKPLIISDRVHPCFHPVVRPLKYFQRKVYAKNNVYLHAQGLLISTWLEKQYLKKVRIIPNFIHSPLKISSSTRTKTVVSIGRYGWQKGTDVLIEAWSQIPKNIRSNWSLVFYGAGNKEKYNSLIAQFKIFDSVKLYSARTNLEPLYEKAGIFVSASRYEGFPNALGEAMARGVPSLSTDNPSAVRDLTRNGELAMLVGLDSSDIAQGLTELMQDEKLRLFYSQSGTEVTTLFGEEIVLGAWSDFFRDILETHKK